MPSETESEYIENESSTSFSESTLENLRMQRETMLGNYRSYIEKYKRCEIREYIKYAMLSDVKETDIFENDSEDLGIREDLEMLHIGGRK